MLVQSQISPQELKLAYQSLRQAALDQDKTARLEIAALPVDILSSQLDQDPQTTDTIVARSWDGRMSSTTATLTFRETCQAGKQILEFSADQPRSLFGGGVDHSSAQIDLSNGELLSASGTGNFLISQAAPVVPPASSPQELLFASIHGKYREIQQHLAQGEQEFSQGLGKTTVKESAPGYVQVESWDGGFSSSCSTETYREYSEGAGEMLEYTRFTPGSPFMVGSAAENIRHTLPLR